MHKEFLEIRNSVNFTNKLYEEAMEVVKAVRCENVEIKSRSGKLRTSVKG